MWRISRLTLTILFRPNVSIFSAAVVVVVVDVVVAFAVAVDDVVAVDDDVAVSVAVAVEYDVAVVVVVMSLKWKINVDQFHEFICICFLLLYVDAFNDTLKYIRTIFPQRVYFSPSNQILS